MEDAQSTSRLGEWPIDERERLSVRPAVVPKTLLPNEISRADVEVAPSDTHRPATSRHPSTDVICKSSDLISGASHQGHRMPFVSFLSLVSDGFQRR